VTLIVYLGLASILFVIAFTWQACSGPEVSGGQTRRESIIEAWTNIVVGFSLNYLVNLFMLPQMTDGGHLSLMSNFWGGWCFTAVSMLRQYILRRFFNSRGFATWLSRKLNATQRTL
jgi:hypothetical protein